MARMAYPDSARIVATSTDGMPKMLMLRLPVTLLLCLLVAACAVSPYSEEGREASRQLLQKEASVARSQIESQPVSVIYAGFALHDGSTAFEGDIKTIKTMSTLMNRAAPDNVQLLSSNKPGFGKNTLPSATEHDVANGIEAAAALERAAVEKYGKAPLLVVLLSSHGAPGIVAVKAGDASARITAADLRDSLKPLAPYPTLIIVSACFSGSLINDLKTEKRIIMTAASADRPSFGCQSNSERTWFVDSLAKAFSTDETLRQWYDATVHDVAQREIAMGYKPSQPRFWIGKSMQPYAQAMLKEMAAQQPANMQAPVASSESATEPKPAEE
jgi:hypothetical protein